MRNVEQLYQLRVDPYEERDLVQAHAILQPPTATATAPTIARTTDAVADAAMTLPNPEADHALRVFRAMREHMQRDLANISALCGV